MPKFSVDAYRIDEVISVHAVLGEITATFIIEGDPNPIVLTSEFLNGIIPEVGDYYIEPPMGMGWVKKRAAFDMTYSLLIPLKGIVGPNGTQVYYKGNGNNEDLEYRAYIGSDPWIADNGLSPKLFAGVGVGELPHPRGMGVRELPHPRGMGVGEHG